MAGSELSAKIEVEVPTNEMDKYNKDLIDYMDSLGFAYETSRDYGYQPLFKYDSHEPKFLNVKTIGCSYGAIIWSENAHTKDRFILTIHRTAIGSEGRIRPIVLGIEDNVLQGRVFEQISPD